MNTAQAIEIHPASPELWPQVAALFSTTSALRWCWFKWQVGATTRDASQMGAYGYIRQSARTATLAGNSPAGKPNTREGR